METSAPPSLSVCICVGRRVRVFKACTSWCAPPFKLAALGGVCICSGLPAAGRYSVSRPTPHALRSVQFPPPYVRHFYSTPPGHHLNLSQRDSISGACGCKHQICRCQNTLFNEWRRWRGLPFQPLSRRSGSVGVCVALKYSFAQRWYTMP